MVLVTWKMIRYYTRKCNESDSLVDWPLNEGGKGDHFHLNEIMASKREKGKKTNKIQSSLCR